MSSNSKKGKRNLGNKHFPIAESVSIALKIQLDKFLSDENETELKFPTFLSAQERGFIHETVAKLGLKSKSRGKGVNRYLTIYKRSGSTIIQNDAKLVLDSNMRCIIAELFNAFPITSKEKDDLSCCPEKERSPQLTHKTLGQLNNGVAQVPNTTYNPDLYKFREKLPVYEQRQELLNAILHNQVIIVAGATGCGKTTQLPQLVLDYCQEHKQPARIYCTQPRRISAVSVAERVAYERLEKIGQSVGYQIRLESRVSPRTVLTYCTNGVLLRTLMAGDSSLTGVSHVFVDEVHERDKFSDFLLIALRDALPRFKELKLILMSATMDTQIFSRYFNNCPVITIPGRLHEVQRFYLEDILRITQYKSKKMIQLEKELKAKLKSGQSYWSHLEGQKSSSDSSTSSKESEEKDNSLDPALQADMDEFLDECFKEGSLDSFCQLLYMYLSEGVPVDAARSGARRTGLMAAAAHGAADTVATMLQIGADPSVRDADGKTAYSYAVERGHGECAALLAAPPAPERPRQLDDEELLLDAYHRSVPEDLVDHELMLALVRHIHTTMPKGAILVFMPGYDDIAALRDLLLADAEMNAHKFHAFTLHSEMQTAEQKKAFAPPPPGARKVIVATNIAETSITIDDVVYVVDSCRVKEKHYEAAGGVCSLRCVWAARAALAQRAGRAGRVRAGRAYHASAARAAARAVPARQAAGARHGAGGRAAGARAGAAAARQRARRRGAAQDAGRAVARRGPHGAGPTPARAGRRAAPRQDAAVRVRAQVPRPHPDDRVLPGQQGPVPRGARARGAAPRGRRPPRPRRRLLLRPHGAAARLPGLAGGARGGHGARVLRAVPDLRRQHGGRGAAPRAAAGPAARARAGEGARARRHQGRERQLGALVRREGRARERAVPVRGAPRPRRRPAAHGARAARAAAPRLRAAAGARARPAQPARRLARLRGDLARRPPLLRAHVHAGDAAHGRAVRRAAARRRRRAHAARQPGAALQRQRQRRRGRRRARRGRARARRLDRVRGGRGGRARRRVPAPEAGGAGAAAAGGAGAPARARRRPGAGGGRGRAGRRGARRGAGRAARRGAAAAPRRPAARPGPRPRARPARGGALLRGPRRRPARARRGARQRPLPLRAQHRQEAAEGEAGRRARGGVLPERVPGAARGGRRARGTPRLAARRARTAARAQARDQLAGGRRACVGRAGRHRDLRRRRARAARRRRRPRPAPPETPDRARRLTHTHTHCTPYMYRDVHVARQTYNTPYYKTARLTRHTIHRVYDVTG